MASTTLQQLTQRMKEARSEGHGTHDAWAKATQDTKQELLFELQGKIPQELHDLLQLMIDPQIMGVPRG